VRPFLTPPVAGLWVRYASSGGGRIWSGVFAEVDADESIRVLIVDDHPLVRRGLTSLLEGVAGIEVVGSAADGEEAVAFVDENAPDIVLMDVSMPGMGGLEAARRLREHSPNIRVVMLTSFSQHDVVVEAFDSGAVGYLLKDSAPDELINGIRAAARGDAPVSPRAAKELLDERTQRRPLDELTARERDVLTLVGRGLTNKQVAWRLGISEKTVKAHLGSVFDRLGVQDRTQAALWAQKHGLT
jgi:DNA-binding NarL/FixJ family response regulator